MGHLSISRAWDETKAIVARDGKLFTSVGLALIALPTAVSTVIMPSGRSQSTALWVDIVIIIASLVVLAGQLALIRLAIGPSITVGGAITHGLRRMPFYFVAVLLIVIVLVLAAIPFATVLAAAGVNLDQAARQVSGPLLIGALLYCALLVFVAVRMIMAAPAASAEHIGPVRIILRSWSLTHGHFWRLLGFLLLFFIAAIVVLMAVQSAVILVTTMTLGRADPMSASALVMALVQGLANAAVSGFFVVMIARLYVQLAEGGATQASVPSSGT